MAAIQGSLTSVDTPDNAAEQPEPIFRGTLEENPHSARLVRWKGAVDFATFNDMFQTGLKPGCEPAGTEKDMKFLQELDLPEDTYCGQDSELLRFICIPKQTYGEALPKFAEIVRDLRNEASFCGDGNEVGDFKDLISTDREEQYFFETEKTNEGITGLNEDDYAKNEDDRRVHAELEGYMRGKRLYYALFHCKHDPIHKIPFDVYQYLVGVSPHSGNLVGVLNMQTCHNFCD